MTEISEKHLRIQQIANRVKTAAELLSGVVAIVEAIRAVRMDHLPHVSTFFAFVIALLALAEITIHWRRAHVTKSVIEMCGGAISALIAGLAIRGNHTVEILDLFLIVLGVVAAIEAWIHWVHAKNSRK